MQNVRLRYRILLYFVQRCVILAHYFYEERVFMGLFNRIIDKMVKRSKCIYREPATVAVVIERRVMIATKTISLFLFLNGTLSLTILSIILLKSPIKTLSS